jgi:prepilin-type processing-associated H-X9-DG protein
MRAPTHIPAHSRSRRGYTRRGYTWPELVWCAGITCFLLVLPIMWAVKSREEARKTQCSHNLKHLIIGMHNFESAMGRLPGATAGGPSRLSMFVDLLPYLEARAWPTFNLAAPQPSILSLPDAPLAHPATWALNPALPVCGPAGIHRQALSMQVNVYHCPSDPSGWVGLSYVPIVSPSHPDWPDRGARTSGDELLEGAWPASSEGFSGQIEQPLALPPYASRMQPPALGFSDGPSFTILLAERVKGAHVTGIRDELNTAYYGADPSGFLVQGGVIVQDNAAAVARCRQNAASGNRLVPGPNHNDLSGAQWLQYTCVWMGCANTMGPPNSPVCSAGGNRAIAESGIAPPSSRHGPGANCGFADGTVRFINDEVDLRVFHALGTINGSEPVGLYK